jgi:hypothetical protein
VHKDPLVRQVAAPVELETMAATEAPEETAAMAERSQVTAELVALAEPVVLVELVEPVVKRQKQRVLQVMPVPVVLVVPAELAVSVATPLQERMAQVALVELAARPDKVE